MTSRANVATSSGLTASHPCVSIVGGQGGVQLYRILSSSLSFCPKSLGEVYIVYSTPSCHTQDSYMTAYAFANANWQNTKCVKIHLEILDRVDHSATMHACIAKLYIDPFMAIYMAGSGK